MLLGLRCDACNLHNPHEFRQKGIRQCQRVYQDRHAAGFRGSVKLSTPCGFSSTASQAIGDEAETGSFRKVRLIPSQRRICAAKIG